LKLLICEVYDKLQLSYAPTVL